MGGPALQVMTWLSTYISLTEGRWFERGLQESIHVKLDRPSLNRGGDL